MILAHKRKAHVYLEYLLDVQKGAAPPVTKAYFLSVWKKNVGSKIVIRKCMRFALCDTCSKIQRAREETNDRTRLSRLLDEERDHLKLVKAERQAYARRMREAIDSDGQVLSIALDGADQGAYGLPYYSQVRRVHFCPVTSYSPPKRRQRCSNSVST